MSKQTAMQQLLHQMREERAKLPLPIEWSRAYQAIEMMIQSTYIPMEKEQIVDAYRDGRSDQQSEKNTLWYNRNAEYYYNETYGGGEE